MPGAPVGIKCFESMLYMAAGSSVHAIDLRTMKKSFTAAVCKPHLYSFEMLPSRSLLCTGGSNRAVLWDIRKSQDGRYLEPLAELVDHNGPVKYVHMDPYKIVTAGPYDYCINVCDVESDTQLNTLNWCDSELLDVSMGRQLHAMAVDGSRIVTAGCGDDGLVRFRDFSNASCSVCSYEDQVASKFWNSKTCIDSDSDE